MAVKAQCYTTLVRPIMEYACIIWEPVTQKNIRELEMVQRRAARFVTGDYRTTSSVTRMLEALQWTKLQQRRKRANVIMLYRIVNHLITISPQPYIIPRQGRIQRGAHPARAPPKIGKNKIFWRKIVIFTRNTPQIFAPPSAWRNFF